MKKMPKLASFDDCMGCMLCADVCTQHAIVMKEDINGFWMPQIDVTKCVGCLVCEKKCKTVRTSQLQNLCDIPLRAYNTDDSARISSASGGVFSAIAKHAIKSRNAIIYGAT